jgi:hypothetical protein
VQLRMTRTLPVRMNAQQRTPLHADVKVNSPFPDGSSVVERKKKENKVKKVPIKVEKDQDRETGKN